ncbi:hypothetical protein ABB37_08047 [Leptomonas pyrrhocoris]|uniref:Uncharacterized protein n=1 Tax=Leptomonas pyrrhocoris TaxID=157538 RepID=A0A0M9FTR5_LEPPY|nr:hypothetical protein ABB37_08047 [Leptomonas pyrrhocoris]KPA75853.1 hypothetical protein ABB37_08047 [Leptomonas pyrrhocoris]|eukprot:XP_015654292.1 hypothetical protein ABB37_08047 [Leptomonas pyrrhocoris]
MNFLSSVYNDQSYRTYLDTGPRFCVVAVSESMEVAEKIAQVIMQVSPRVNIVCTDKVVKTVNETKFPHADTFRLLRSNWCVKHQTSVFSCALLICFVDRLESGADAFKIAKDLVSRLGTPTETLRHFVIFVPYSDYAGNPRSALCDEIEKHLRGLVGNRFVGTALQTDQDSVWRGIAALQKMGADACVAYHTDEVQRLRGRKNAASLDPEQERLVPRLHFKLGWHYLVLHDFSNARRQMLSGLRKLKSMFPMFPSFQFRMCGSIFLYHFLSCVSSCGGHMSSSSEVFQEVRRYVDWIGSAYGGSVCDECQTVTSVLTKLLEAEWLEFLARKTENLDTRSCCDYLMAAAQALQECMAFLPSRHDGDTVCAPSHIGEEELLDEHAADLWKCCDKVAVRKRIVRLLGEAKSQTSCRETEVNYLNFLASNDVLDEAPDMHLVDEIVTKASCPIISRLAEVACGALNMWKSISPPLTAALLLNGCVDPVNYVEQEKFQHRLHELEGCLGSDTVLQYPKGQLLAPFTAIAYFDEEREKVVGERARVVVVLFSTSTRVVEIDMHTLTFSSSSVKGSPETHLPLTPARRVKLSAATPQRILVEVPLAHAGRFSCSSVTADVRIAGFTVTVRWHFDAAHSMTAHPISSKTRDAILPQRSRTVLEVANPSTVFRIECPSLIQAVEGECAECEIRVSCAVLEVTGAFMTIPHEPKLFRVVCWNGSNETLLATNEDGEIHFALPDLSPNSSVRLIMSVGCIRSSEFRLPVSFRCLTERYGELRCSKSLHISVYPPFNVEHAFIGSNLWGDGEAALQLPSVSPSYVQYDNSMLVKASDIFRSPLITNWKDDCALYFFTKVATAEQFVFTAQDTITLSCTFRCTASKGLTIVKADVIGGEDVELLSCCGCDQNSFLEEGECATVVTRFRARRLGRLTPGFIRVFFSPQHSSARLYSDVYIPAVQIEDSGIKISVHYPLVTSRGSALRLEVTVYNNTSSPFLGELLLNTQQDDFACTAAARQTLQIGPEGRSVSRYLLSPLRVGELMVPAIKVRSAATSRTVANGEGGYVVHVLPDGQASLVEDPK